jgi:hypothetical protein
MHVQKLDTKLKRKGSARRFMYESTEARKPERQTKQPIKSIRRKGE